MSGKVTEAVVAKIEMPTELVRKKRFNRMSAWLKYGQRQ